MKIKSPYIIELADTIGQNHWYKVWVKKENNNKGKYLGVFPSATTILTAYPQSQQLTKWIAEQGWVESQEIKSRAGHDGISVHNAAESLLNGVELSRDTYKTEIWYKIDAFARWHSAYKPKILALELAVFSKKLKIAGRLDCLCEINKKIYILDYKTSASIHKHFPLQFAAYAQAVEEMGIDVDLTAALHLGANNKDGYRFVEYPDWDKEHLPVFKSVHITWNYDVKKQGAKNVEPPVLILPDKIKLNL